MRTRRVERGRVQHNLSRCQSSFSGTLRDRNRRRLYRTVGAMGSKFVSRQVSGMRAAYPTVVTAWRWILAILGKVEVC